MQKKILIVDEDTELRSLLKRALTNNNFWVQEAADGLEALELVETTKPDLVLLDFGLPKLPGETVCIKIKQNYPGVIVIVLTGKTLSSDVVHGLQIGADDYIKKPFEMDELVARIDARLKNSGKANIFNEEVDIEDEDARSVESKPDRILFRESKRLLVLKLIVAQAILGIIFILGYSFIFMMADSLDSASIFYLYTGLFISLIVTDILLTLYIILDWKSNYVEVTKSGIIKNSGILSKREKKYACHFVESVTFDQSFLGRILNYGTIELYDPALTERVYLINISTPKKYRVMIEKLFSRPKEREIPFLTETEEGI